MSISSLKDRLPSYAKDTKINLSRVISEEGAEDLSMNQTYSIALACAYAIKNPMVINAIYDEVKGRISENEKEAAKAAATIMAMNNVYYRFTHLVSDPEYSKLPANLRMSIIGNPGITKTDFELMCLAISTLNGCGMCMDSHANALIQDGISKTGIQSAVRIAAVLSAAAQAIIIDSV